MSASVYGGRRSLYTRMLRLRYLRPGALASFLLFECVVVAGALLAFAELLNWRAVLVLPVAVAATVKLNDVIVGEFATVPRRVVAVGRHPVIAASLPLSRSPAPGVFARAVPETRRATDELPTGEPALWCPSEAGSGGALYTGAGYMTSRARHGAESPVGGTNPVGRVVRHGGWPRKQPAADAKTPPGRLPKRRRY